MSKDASGDRAGATSLAERLEKERESILTEWMASVRADPKIPSADGLTLSALEDHLPEILSELGKTLKGENDGKSDDEAEGSARSHGKTRWRAGYRLDELLRELVRMRQAILYRAREFLHGREAEEDRLKIEETIRLFFDRVAATSAQEHVEAGRAELILRTQQLHAAYSQVHAATEQLRAVADSRLRLVRGAVHELRNAMNTVMLTAHVLRDAEDAAVREDAEARLQSSARHLHRLTDRLQQYSDALGGESAMELTKVEVAEFLKGLEAAHQSACEAKGLELRVTSSPELRRVITDASKLQTIATVLIENAIGFTPRGEVRISAELAGPDRWIFQVEDTGVGIRPSEAARIFSEFHREEGSTSGGAGLGLLLARHFARLLDGEITFDSEPGRGSRFRVDLPLRSRAEAPALEPRLGV